MSCCVVAQSPSSTSSHNPEAIHALVATFSKGPYGHVSDAVLPASVVGQAKEPFEVRMVWELQGGAGGSGVGVGITLLIGEMRGGGGVGVRITLLVGEMGGGGGVGVGITLLVGEMGGEEVIWKEVVGRVVVGTEV